MGAVLSQLQDGKERVIAYARCTLSKSQRNYCVTDRELLAVVHFIEYYKHYLLGKEFLVRTDHQALRWLFSLKEPKNRVARWIESLSAFNFSIEYRPGNKHGNADALSRCPVPQNCQCQNTIGMGLACGPCQKCQKKSKDMNSKLAGQDTENTIRRVPDHALEHKTKTSILKDYTTRSMRQISNIVQWLPKTTIVTTLFIIGIIFSYIRVIGNQISNKTQASVWTEGQTHPCVMRNCCRVETRSSAKAKQKEIDLQQENKPLKAPQKQPHKQKKFRDKPGWASNYSMVNLRKKQLDDPDISPILKWFESGKRPHGQEICASSPATRHFWNSWDMLKLHDGVLFRHFNIRNGISQYQQFLVPRSMKKEIIDEMHQCILSGGHLAKKKTRMKILQRFYWFGLRDDVNLYIEQCDNCGANKTPPKTPRAPLGEMRVGAPMDRLATDILGPLPTTPRGNRYVLIVTDYFSNWVEVLPIPDQTAETTAEVILNEVISRYGCPLDIHSDQGPNYRSELFTELCRLLEIRKTRSSARNPKCNGKVERFNKTLVRMVRAYLKGQQREWDRNLGCLAAAYRASPHEATGFTPNLLMMGREVRVPAEVMFGSSTKGEEMTSYGQFVDWLKRRMQCAHDVARAHLKTTAKRQKDQYDAKSSLIKYEIGNLVWYLAEKSKIGENPKLYSPYEGPYLIVDKFSDLTYNIQMEPKGKTKVVNHNKLKKYEGNIKYKWAKTAIERAKAHNLPNTLTDDSESSSSE